MPAISWAHSLPSASWLSRADADQDISGGHPRSSRVEMGKEKDTVEASFLAGNTLPWASSVWSMDTCHAAAFSKEPAEGAGSRRQTPPRASDGSISNSDFRLFL